MSKDEFVTRGYFKEGQMGYAPGRYCDFNKKTADKLLKRRHIIRRIRTATKEPPETREGGSE